MTPTRSASGVALWAGWVIAVLSSLVSILMVVQFNNMSARLAKIEQATDKIGAIQTSITYIDRACTENTAEIKRLQETKADK